MDKSFIENINKLASNIDIVKYSNKIFDDSVMPVLEEIAELDLDLAIEDLKKGTFFGNRKIDIDLSLNKQGITPDMSDADATLVWSEETTTVYYSGATVTFVDGTIKEIPFVNDDADPISISNHGTLVYQLLNNIPFTDYLTETGMFDDVGGMTGTMFRVYDIVGQTSNVERVQLHVDTNQGGSYNHPNPIYYWGLTTSAFQTLAMRTADIIKLGNDIDSIIAIANEVEKLLPINEKLSELVTNEDSIYKNISKLNVIYDEILAITTLYDDVKVGGTNYINTASIDLQLGASSKINTLATDLQLGDSSVIVIVKSSIDNVNIVSQNIDNVNTTATSISNVNIVAGSIDNVNLVGASITKVDTVSDDIESVNIVSADIESVNIVSADIANVETVATNMTTIISVNDNELNINEVNANKTNIDLNATNITAIQNASANAQTATDKATIATQQAQIATDKSDEIKAVTVSSTTTGAAGTSALVTYNSSTGTFAFVVPKGDKGDKGDAFLVNSVGLLEDKSLYDDMDKGFSFLAIDDAEIYFKLSDDSADWSDAAPFGKGEKGDIGDTGVGIVSIVKTDGDGSAGTTDTYTITYSDDSDDTFTVYNGKDSVLIDDEAITLVDTWSSQKISDELDLKANQETTYTKDENDTALALKANQSELEAVKQSAVAMAIILG